MCKISKIQHLQNQYISKIRNLEKDMDITVAGYLGYEIIDISVPQRVRITLGSHISNIYTHMCLVK